MSIAEQKHSREQLVIISGEIARHDTRMERCRIHDAQTIFQGNDGKGKQKERLIMRFPVLMVYNKGTMVLKRKNISIKKCNLFSWHRQLVTG